LAELKSFVAVVGSALLLCFKAGEHEERQSPTPYKKTLQALTFSTFTRGFDFLRKLLFQAREEAMKLLASFLEKAAFQTFSHDHQKNHTVVRRPA